MPAAPQGLTTDRDSPLLLGMYGLAYLSVLVRMLLNGDGTVQPPAYGLMAGFLALAVAQQALRRWTAATHAALSLQSVVTIVLLFTQPQMDSYAVLFVALCVIAGRDLSERPALVWIGLLCVLCVLALGAAFGARAAGYAPSYIAAALIIGLYGRAARNAEMARARSDGLRRELEATNQRLHAYAERVEEAAAEQERAHLARDLHDAATQTVFSLNLTAEAARLAMRGDPQKAAGLIDRVQELAGEALAEMRTLVRELRPSSVADEGLVGSLRRLAALSQRRHGLRVQITVSGDEQGSVEMRETVFRTAREALNNVGKHAGVSECRLDLRFGPPETSLVVRDSGAGFDPRASRGQEGYGLVAMRERVEGSGGTFALRSSPGAGTEVEARFAKEPSGGGTP